jgi:hypothetical protein
MRVLFLALGATRRRTVAAESAAVVAAGGRAVVLIEAPDEWKRVTFAPGVEVVDVYGSQRGRSARKATDLVLFRGPGYLFHQLARGPLERPVRRIARGYRYRIAHRVNDRVVMPTYRRLWRGARRRVVEERLGGADFDLLVISDPASLAEGVSMLGRYRDGAGPQVTYRLDVAPAALAAGL